ncbi:MAG TPA: Ig-like domain-containing protein [Anaerolineales bacterium]|nr:Ig-like domain-containing protein [Anaerolineales bacterium]
MKLKKFAPRKNAAQAIVEFAIVLPVLLLLLYGLLEAGRLLFMYSSVVTASRQAARYGSATGQGGNWLSEGGPDNSGVPRYQDCYGIRRAAKRADYLNAFNIATPGDIVIGYDAGTDVAGNPIAISPAWADGNSTCDGPNDTNVIPSNNNTTRINVKVTGHFASIVPKIVPFISRPIEAESARTILMAVSIQVGSGTGPVNPTWTVTDSSSPGAGQPGQTQPGEDFTLTVSLNGTAGPAAGTVVFSVGSTVICTTTLTNGNAACAMNLPATDTITVTYNPTDPTVYNSDVFNIPHNVGPSDTITEIVDSPDQSLPNGNVIITVHVKNKYGGSIPTGTVAVSTVAGNCNITLIGSYGSCPMVFSALGTSTITAAYSPGDADHLASNGSTTHEVVNVIVDTPIPPTAIPNTPVPPTVAPVTGCNYIRDNAGAISFSAKTMTLTLKNTANNYPVTVSSVFVAWNYSAGHIGGDESLWLLKADLNGTVFWSSPAPGINQPGALLPLSTAVVIPANGTAKITFTFNQIYNRLSNNEQVQIQFSTFGCENYPVIRPAGMPTITPVSGPNLKVQVISAGTDNSAETQFRFQVTNIGNAAGSNISVRIYFQIDNPLKETDYVLGQVSDSSGVATITGPTQLTNKIFYYTINYGSASLAAGSSWQYHASLHLIPPKNGQDAYNDPWHTTGVLPPGWTDWPAIPAYINTARVWGIEP